MYLSPVVDLFDGKPVGWAVGTSPDARLTESSLEMACATLGEGEAPVAHTDRGCHYRWPGWKAICGRHGLARSMSRKGTSPDNAACEGFFGNLKNEFFHGRDWSGWTAEAFMELLDGWMAAYSTVRLKAFREGGRTVYDTIDNRRRRLGLWSGQDFLDNYLRIFRLLRALSRKEHCSQWRNASSVCCSRARCT